jgi:protocatechuate 4,5-dioxygenase alpha chain
MSEDTRSLDYRERTSDSPGSNWREAMPSATAYLVSKVLYRLHHRPDDLAAFTADRTAYLDRYPLTDALRVALRDDDVAALYRSGANPYLLRAHCIGVGIPEKVSLAALQSAGDVPPHG